MPLKKHAQRVAGDIVVLELSGKRCLCGEDTTAAAAVRQWLDDGYLKFLLNLSDARFIDSGGLAAIVRAYATVQRQGGALKLSSVSQQVRTLLKVTRLSIVFEIFESEEEGLRSFET